MGRALRADAERSVRAILEAAERVLADDPGASMEQIAEAAGVTRITVHRRFANRQALMEALAVSAMRQLVDAIEDARPNAAPAFVALHRVTANALRVKSAWRFALGNPEADAGAAAAMWADINARALDLLSRARREGLLDPAADLEWTRQVYYALLSEALKRPGVDQDPDALATLVIDTLLHGAGPRD
ncbi:TetR/AcrR family transcriptional regulator [Streptomyces litchfieldiae]|uniref:Helix-turn-helix domain-containing protein n=1 Tax=Streptomyces litchfieldiae TaxID=3075543 RepID=A0ABU2MWH6_9ACTN|nr:helix-turn-helix domain-containing protein [Streptomyces sp. DSM 44938]MDT0346001.1 helix-turn-helix domain-containing protein [Streptomyces sp. DSM 44938]